MEQVDSHVESDFRGIVRVPHVFGKRVAKDRVMVFNNESSY